MITVGLAICDKAVDDYSLSRIAGGRIADRDIPKLNLDMVELQLEEWSKYNLIFRGQAIPDFFSGSRPVNNSSLLDQALKEVKSKKIKSYHAPIKSGNIASPDEKVRLQAVAVTQKAMDLAQSFGTDIFVLHPCCYDWNYWERFRETTPNYMSFRKLTHQVFLKSLSKLADHYASGNHTFQIGIENLEFNQYPSTLDEIRSLLHDSREVWQRKNPGKKNVGLVLDIQHLKHSKTILKDKIPNPIEYLLDREEYYRLASYTHTPICNEHNYTPPPGAGMPIINSAFQTFRDDIILVHLSGNNHRHATHDPILYDLRTYYYSKEQYDNGVLNMRQVLDIIYYSGYRGPIILEIMSGKELLEEKFEDEAATLHNVRTYLEHLHQKNEKENR